MSTQKTIYMAELETRSFSWMAFGESESEARRAMKNMWNQWRRCNGADRHMMDTWADVEVDVGIIEIPLGKGIGFKDRREFYREA